jgi:hypothetical protein
MSVPAKTNEAKDVATSFCITAPFEACFTTASSFNFAVLKAGDQGVTK